MLRLARLPRLRNRYLVRGILVWFLIRFGAASGAAFGGSPGGALFLNLQATLWVLLMVALTVALYARRRWEDILLGNLGIPLWEAAAWALPLPVAAEILMPGQPGDPGPARVPDPRAGTVPGGMDGSTLWGSLPLLVGGIRGRGTTPPMPAPGTPVLEADGLGKSFGRTRVLKSASFRAVAGEIVTLMGRNGSGKTTMLRISVGRVAAGWGRIAWRGEYLPRPRLHRMADQGMFFSAQESALTSHFTVRQHLAAVVRVFGGEGRMPEVVETMRLEEFLDRRPHRISGGERQRASLAMALLRRPVCLLADEPFAGVAPADRPLITRGLRLLREAGCAVVISGHDVEDLFQVSDQVIWVVAGTTHWLGPPAQAFTHPQFRQEYLGPRGIG